MLTEYNHRLETLTRKALRWPPLAPPVPPACLPAHLAIIMDGNGRWATGQGLRRIKGHQVGAESVRQVTRHCGQIGIKTLTLYAFSTENWRRSKTEINFLFRLLKKYLVRERPELMANQVRLTSIGDTSALSAEVQAELSLTERLTANNTGLNLCLALNYGAQDEIVSAVRTLTTRVSDGELQLEQITAELFEKSLFTAHLPPVALLIRTAGERRLSNFLLWQACGADFYVAPVCWPDFRVEHLREAIVQYANRAVRGE
ncbi:MAG: polyprenyl diphosphate synthase [Planctomycetota bacterium]